MTAIYRRWTPRGMVEAFEAQGFSVTGFEGARLFTGREHGDDGRLYYRAYDARSGHAFGEHHLQRNVCVAQARRLLLKIGREAFETAVSSCLAHREGG